MEQRRYIETGSDSFFGEYLYNQIVPQGHFLRKLKQYINWKRFSRGMLFPVRMGFRTKADIILQRGRSGGQTSI
jgi:hypothetical protein